MPSTTNRPPVQSTALIGREDSAGGSVSNGMTMTTEQRLSFAEAQRDYLRDLLGRTKAQIQGLHLTMLGAEVESALKMLPGTGDAWIVRACESHEALLAALNEARPFVAEYGNQGVLNRIGDALRKAGGQP